VVEDGADGWLIALDPELDRRVALRVVGGDPDGEPHGRAVRAAQAMARLAHANVVRVFEVGDAGDQRYIATELVDGDRLDGWLTGRRRSWREIVEVFVAAGRGLAAAHAAGLVHGDLRADRIWVGRDRRPRVDGFGLAERRAFPGEPEEVTGTPSHLAPELWGGAEPDARSDQFAFAVTLWTALQGEPPFAGGSPAELRAAIIGGERRPWRAWASGTGGAPPIDLGRALERALAVAPYARWPGLGALVAALERARAARRTALLGTSAAVAAVLIGVVISARRGAPVDPCPPPAGRLAAVWGAPRLAALAHRAAIIDPEVGPGRVAAVVVALDRGAAAWSAMHVEACRATRVAGWQSDAALDARIRCLGDWLAGFAAVVEGIERAADPAELDGAVEATAALGALDRCADGALLVASDEPTPRPAARAEVEAIRRELATLRIALAAGRIEGAALRGDALVARARRLDHPPTLSRALAVRWRASYLSDNLSAALPFLRELTAVAALARDDVEAAVTWAALAAATARRRGEQDAAQAMLGSARASAARAGDPPLVRAEVLSREADVALTVDDHRAARAALAEARALLLRHGADQPGAAAGGTLAGVLHSEGSAAWLANDLDHAVAALRRSIALYERLFGAEASASAAVYSRLAQVLRDQGHGDDAERAIGRAIHILDRRGDSSLLAIALAIRSQLGVERGQVADAVSDAERALRVARAVTPDDGVALAEILSDVARAYHNAGLVAHDDRLVDRAAAAYAELLAIATRAGWVTSNVAVWFYNLGDLERRRGRCAVGLPGFVRAREVIVAAAPDSPVFGAVLRGEAACLRALGRAPEAIARLAQARATPMVATLATDVALGDGLLGQLLADTGRDPVRGIALVRAALAALEAAGSDDPRRAELARWLAGRRGRAGSPRAAPGQH
jgi:eukaryotic-like serine/threonine-protein kinase